MKTFPIMVLLAAVCVALVPFAVFAQHEGGQHPSQPNRAVLPNAEESPPGAAADAKPARASDPYPLPTCPVSGKTLGEMGEPVVKTYDGREVRFCCSGCVEKFEAAMPDYWSKIDGAIVKDQTPFYPLTTCIISGESLAEDGKDIAVNYVYRNRLIRFCCAGCIKDFLRDPEVALGTLDAAVAGQQRERYPLNTCPVSGEPLGSMGEPYEVVVNNHLVRLCCAGCEEQLRSQPLKYLTTLDEAWKARGMPHATDTLPAAAGEKLRASEAESHDKHDHGGK